MESVLIILLAVLCTALPFWLGQRYGVARLVSPMHLLSYFCFFGFLLKTVVYAFQPELAFYRKYVDNPWGDQLGALYLGLFILFMCGGYRLGCTVTDRPNAIAAARLVASGIIRRGALCMAGFGIAFATIMLILDARGSTGLNSDVIVGLNSAKQINVNADGVGATLAGIKTFFIVPKFAFILLLAHGLVSEQGGSKVLATLLGGLLVLVALVSGDRFELVELMVFTLATLMIVGGHISGRMIFGGACIIALLGLLSAYMTTLRHSGQADGLLHQIVGSTYFLDINAAIMVTDRVQPADYLLGDSYTWWRFGWIPRAIWMDKPAIDLGVMFKRDVMGLSTGGAFNVTGPGEAFINFGWAGILIGFVLGWTYRKGEELLLAGQATLRHGAALLYPILFYPFVQATLQSSFSAFIVGAGAQLVLITLMVSLCVTRYAAPKHIVGRTFHAA